MKLTKKKNNVVALFPNFKKMINFNWCTKFSINKFVFVFAYKKHFSVRPHDSQFLFDKEVVIRMTQYLNQGEGSRDSIDQVLDSWMIDVTIIVVDDDGRGISMIKLIHH